MLVRTGGAARHADSADHLSAHDAVADFHYLPALMQITGRDAMTVIEDRPAPKCGSIGLPFRMRWLPNAPLMPSSLGSAS
jgi:hypothetical protein